MKEPDQTAGEVLPQATTDPSAETAPDTGHWTPEDVAHRLRETVNTLRLLPMPARISRIGSAWPAVPSTPESARLGYGYDAVQVKPRQPTAAEIDRMDQAIRWMLVYMAEPIATEAGLAPDTNRVMWCRALGVPIPVIMDIRRQRWGHGRRTGGLSPVPGGNSRPSVREIYRWGLRFMADALNAAGEPHTAEDVAPIRPSRSNTHASGSA